MDNIINQIINVNNVNVDISIVEFSLNLIICAILAHILSYVYENYGDSLSNRINFSRNFIPLSLTTALIITIVKSSLALSLGLVGALSIIRFRAAIKEPEELAYIFITIALGLGFGANQAIITIIGFIFIILFVVYRKTYSNKVVESQNLHLIISHDSKGSKDFDLNEVIEVVKRYSSAVTMNRFEQTSSGTEISLLVDLKTFEDFNIIKQDLLKVNSSINIIFIEERS
jgi:hypothetical protein